MGTDKALIDVDGTTMLAHVASALVEAGARPIVVVGGPDRGLGYLHVDDAHPGEGPLGAIITALARVDADLVLAVACDLPALDASTVRALVDAVGDHDAAVARTDRLEPLCAIWRRTCLPVLEEAFTRGERSPLRAIGSLDVAVVPVAAGALANINTPADLAAFRQAAN